MKRDAIYNTHLDLFLLWASRETGVLAAVLEGPVEAETVADRTGVTDRAARVVLDALAEMGYVERVEGSYDATDRLDGFRPETAPAEKGVLPYRVAVLDRYVDLPAAMQTGELPAQTPAEREGFMGALATVGEPTVRAIVTAAERAHPRPDRVLDVRGGPGRFAAEFARRGADVTLVDRPAVLDGLDAHDGASYDVVAGDARESLPEGFDLVFGARMTLFYAPSELRDYFGAAFDALDPGGSVVATEHVRDRAAIGDRFEAHLLALPAFERLYTEAEYRSALADAGFADVTVREVPGTAFQSVIGDKPE
jgi:SAM-dependent methyltransferase